jgi:hypothetical protein
MSQKARNPLAQALGIVLQGIRDKMGGISSTEIAKKLGLAASHYRMIEAGSAIIQPSRAVRIVQTFDTIEFIPLCQVLVAIQILDSNRQHISDMRTTAELICEANPALVRVLKKMEKLWAIIENAEPSDVAKTIVSQGLKDELEKFLTTEPVIFTADEIDNFMSPTYEHPLAGPLYSKIGNILQGVAPFYLDTVLQLIGNLRDVTPRATAEELARWEVLHKERFTHVIGIIRTPEIILDVSTFDYSYLWDDHFHKMLIVYRNQPTERDRTIKERIADNLRRRFELEHIKYESELSSFDEVVDHKLTIEHGKDNTSLIDDILSYREVNMNNLWAYVMINGYVIPFIDNATVGPNTSDIYGSSLGYDETSEKLVQIRRLYNDLGLKL